jgi:hypothetical protein
MSTAVEGPFSMHSVDVAGNSIVVAGIEIPSSDPVFLVLVGVHVRR